ncbi:hypothetical protein BH18ACT4_BH18ACT4_02760 [soil metagenome]
MGVKLDFVGARPVAPTGGDRAEGVVSYFARDADQSDTAIPTYSSIVYENLWPGIDMVYSGTGSALKYSLVVHPGADPDQIRLAYRGATGVTVNDAGQLEVSTPAGGLAEDTPYSYHDVGGRRVEVDSAYALDAATDPATTGFAIPVGSYDTTRDLIIDPVVLVYAGYIGGAGQDSGADIAVDGAGNAYVTGFTSSSEASFPVTVGPDVTYNGTIIAYVAKVSPDGAGLVYAGYIEGTTFGHGIAADAAGSAYVTGYTGEANLPAIGGLDPTYNGGGDAFVVKIDPTGTALVYAGYIGQVGYEAGNGIAVDATGSAYIGGASASAEETFPATVGPDVTFNGSYDGFVAKVDPAGAGLVYAGYIGGGQNDGIDAIAIDDSGSAYGTGITTSSENRRFPVTVGPDLTINSRSGNDAFVAKVTADGTDLVYTGYIGGKSGGLGYGIDVDD